MPTQTEERLRVHDLPSAPRLHPMPVEAQDLSAAAADDSRTLGRLAGSPPDLHHVHLGLGPDGQTGLLVPNHPVIEVSDRAAAGESPTV